MYSMPQPAPSVNGGVVGSGANDGLGTINPSALNAPVPHTPGSNVGSQSSPRGLKRSRSPEVHYEPDRNEDDDSKPRKRGRPTRPSKVSESPGPTPVPLPSPLPASAQTPQSSHRAPSQASPPQPSPTKSTPTKSTVVKSLPTVRDHTSTELTEDGDEFIPREYDEAGETKVAANGTPIGGRQYRCRTFFMPNRGERLFMLATECAKVLGYRDSYLLFNKNKSLFKIIANQPEKNDLIQQDILPSSYRSRQIAVVTARSMFRQFGSRLIVNGRRVRDDYWEGKARKQGFTEEDLAGEKRPGAAKAREAAAAAEASNAAALASMPHGQIIYSSNGPSPLETATSMAPVPMINLNPANDVGDYSSVQRPRHEIPGSVYQDRTQPSTATEIMSQATHTAEFNKNLGQQRTNRGKYIEDIWRRPHEPPADQLQPSQGEAAASASQSLRSPQMPAAGGHIGRHQPHTPQSQHQMMAPQAYSQHPLHPGMIAQSPVRSAQQQLPPSAQMHHRSPPVPQGAGGSHQQQGYGGYQQGPQMWPSAQAQPSPLSQAPMQYGQHHLQQQSPHLQHSAVQPQLHHSSSSGSLHGGLGYNIMPGGMNAPGYSGVPRQMYQQPNPNTQQQYMQHQSSAASTQPGMQGWSPAPSHGQSGQQGWQGY